MASKQFHVMMFPWLAFGHMIPFLEISKKLAAKGILVSFVSTPRNIQRLPPVPPNLVDNLKMVETSLPAVDGLPEDREATTDLQPDQIQYLKKAYDQLSKPFEELLQQYLPDFILLDFVACWLPETAAKLGIGSAFFSAYTASTLAFLGPPAELNSGSKNGPEKLQAVPDWFPFPSLVSYSPHYAPSAFQNFVPDESGFSSGQRLAGTVEGCNFVAVRSCKEFEGEYLDLLEQFYQRPVLPIGVLPPSLEQHNRTSSGSLTREWHDIFKWMDEQNPKSVVFVGFGSEYQMPLEQIHELAHGLELSKLPFIWILRKPEGIDSSNLLPSGFSTRTSDQGIVSLGWAPQLEILAHPSIGGCLFHSGWGTIIESLGFGLSQILMPMVADQELCAKLLVEKRVGYEVPRNRDGSFNRNEVAKSMRLVMVEPEGESLRAKAAQMRDIFSNQDLHDNYINKFVDHLYNSRKKEQLASQG